MSAAHLPAAGAHLDYLRLDTAAEALARKPEQAPRGGRSSTVHDGLCSPVATAPSADTRRVRPPVGYARDRIRRVRGWRTLSSESEPRTHEAPEQATRQLIDYLAALEGQHYDFRPELKLTASATDAPATGGPARRLLKAVIPKELRLAIRYELRLRATSAMRVRERSRASALALRSPLLLHLGSGPSRKQGWVNVDLAGDPVDLRWNLKYPLPFDAGTVDGIFHEHLLEHLPLGAGLELMRRSYRLLRAGGVLRIGVPNAGAYLESYSQGGHGIVEEIRPGRPTRMLAVNELFYLFTHRAMYDEETLILFLRTAGFDTVEARRFGDSRLAPCPDSGHREAETLYVEAVK